MIPFRESRIGAHHNYLVNGLMTPGFRYGNPMDGTACFILADPVLPGESTSRVSARLFDSTGKLSMEIRYNRMVAGGGGYAYQSIPGGFRVRFETGDPMLEVRTQAFANGFLTRLRGRGYDERGGIVLETFGESIRICKDGLVLLDNPILEV